jgi:small-conductance mechanosensitive channel
MESFNVTMIRLTTGHNHNEMPTMTTRATRRTLLLLVSTMLMLPFLGSAFSPLLHTSVPTRSGIRGPTTLSALPFSLPIPAQLSGVDGNEPSLLADIAVSGLLIAGTLPAAELAYNITDARLSHSDEYERDFEKTFYCAAVESFTQATAVFALIRLTVTTMNTFGYQEYIPEALQMRTEALEVSTTIFFALVLSAAKRSFFAAQTKNKDPDQLGRTVLIDRLFDFIIAILLGQFLIDLTGVDVGMGFQSLFTASGIGAVFFSLASRGLAEQVVGGLVVKSWNVFKEGDDVELEDGTCGTALRIGLVETEIRRYDNTVVAIPNSKLYNQKVSNISRVKLSQVKQTLRFRYSDVDKVPETIELIKTNIVEACPHLITDGSRPFRVTLFDFKSDSIEVQVNCHFRLDPGSGPYLEERQNMLLAIAKAVKESDVAFALPSVSSYINDDQTW